MPALGGSERRITTITSEMGAWRADATQMNGNPGPVWSPDGESLIVADHLGAGPACGLFRVQLASGSRTQVTFPTGNANESYPAFSPDGRYLAFARFVSNSASDLFVAAQGGAARQLTQDIRGIDWMPDSRELILSSNRSGPYALWALGLDCSMRMIPTNALRATGPAVSCAGWIAYAEALQNTNIWQQHVGDSATAKMLIGSSRRNDSPKFSHDGQHIAFVSDRSGAWEIWLANADGSGAAQLAHFQSPMVGTPRWSPDDQWIAFDAPTEGNSAIFIAPAEGGNPRRIAQNEFEERMPNWSWDGKSLYFNPSRNGRMRLWKSRLDGSGAIRLTSRVAYDSAESRDGKYFYLLSDGPGIWRVPLDGGAEELVPGLETAYPRRYWDVTAKGIYYVEQETKPRHVHFFSFKTGKSTEVAAIDRNLVMDTPSPSISPDGRTLIYAQQDNSGSDIARVAVERRYG